MEDQKISYTVIVQRFDEIGFSTNPSMIQRIRNGSSEPAADFLLALARLELLKDSSGKPLTVENLIDICTGEYRVEPGEIDNTSFATILQYGINLFVPNTEQSSIELFSAETNIPVARLNEILAGGIPDRLEIYEIARIIPNPKTGQYFDSLELALIAGTVSEQENSNVVPLNLGELAKLDKQSATEPGPTDEQLERARATRKKQQDNPTPASKLPPKPGRTTRRNSPQAKRQKRSEQN